MLANIKAGVQRSDSAIVIGAGLLASKSSSQKHRLKNRP